MGQTGVGEFFDRRSDEVSGLEKIDLVRPSGLDEFGLEGLLRVTSLIFRLLR